MIDIFVTYIIPIVAGWQFGTWIVELIKYIHWRRNSEKIDFKASAEIKANIEEIAHLTHLNKDHVLRVLITDAVLRPTRNDNANK